VAAGVLGEPRLTDSLTLPAHHARLGLVRVRFEPNLRLKRLSIDRVNPSESRQSDYLRNTT
jgi:hypothetical protein